MNENQKLRIEKECFEDEYQAFLTKLGKNTLKSRMRKCGNNLAFERIKHGKYLVVNKDTGRFHNPEFGIDWVM